MASSFASWMRQCPSDCKLPGMSSHPERRFEASHYCRVDVDHGLPSKMLRTSRTPSATAFRFPAARSAVMNTARRRSIASA